MSETRVKRYQSYRNKLAKAEDDVTYSPKKKVSTDTLSMTDSLTSSKALPIEEVIKSLGELDEEEILLKQKKRKQIIKLILLIAGLVLLAVGFTIFGILVF